MRSQPLDSLGVAAPGDERTPVQRRETPPPVQAQTSILFHKTGQTVFLSLRERIPLNGISRFEALNCRSRREEALISFPPPRAGLLTLTPPSHGGPPGPGFFGKFHQE